MNRLSRLYTSLSNVLIVLAIVCAPLMARATTVATPVISLAAGTYVGAQTVTITDSTSGSKIYYTTDGSAPTASSTLYTGGITVSSSETLKAIATATGDTSSATATATYTIAGTLKVYISPPGAQSTTVAGAATETFDALSALSTANPHTTAYISTAGIGTYTGSTSQPFAIEAPGEFGGALDTPTSKTTTNYFAVGGDSGSTSPVYLTLTNPVSYFGFWWSAGDQYNMVALYSGSTLYGTFSTANLLSFLNNGTGTITASNGTAYQASAYFGNPNIPSGTNDATQPFAYVSFVISGATINKIAFYNTGTGTSFESDNHSAIFSGNTVTIPTTFVPVETLALSSQAVPPVFSVAAGTYATPQTVAVTSATPGASIVYTTNGTTPTLTNGIICASPNPCSVSVAISETLEAIAYETGMTNSAVASATYTIPLSVTVSPATATVTAGGTQQFTATVVGSTNTAVTWSISPATGAGTINSSGLYTAPSSVTTQQTVTITATSAANTSVKATSTVTLKATPSISGLSPTSGAVGTAVTIAGTNFGTTQGSSTVAFNGTAATSISSWSSTSIKAVVPTGATSGNVVVTASGVASNGMTFTVPAMISGLSPTSGAAGTTVTIAGTNFGTTQGTSTVTFNGTAATIVTWSNTAIAAKVPTGATSGNVVVTVSGVVSNGSPFSVLPGISSLSPTSGAAGTTVAIAGTNFGTTQGTSTVTFNGTAATIVTWSNTAIAAKVPTGATSGNVVVTVSGVASNGSPFSVLPGISSLSPTSGAAGTTVAIAGTNFGTTQGTSTVTFNGTAATIVTWSNTAIAAKVPTGATTGNVVVTVGGLASNGMTFTVPAVISGLSPTSGAVGTTVTIAGTNFGATQGTSTVTFNGTAATIVTWSNTSIAAKVSAGATTGNVVVTVSGVASNGSPFSVLPGISSLSPTSGAAGTTVTIAGTNFGATQGSSTVTFNGTAATIVTWSNTSIAAKVPMGATTGNVVVTVGGLASSGMTFTVPAVISGLSPTSGAVGTTVTIAGTNFGATQGTSTVTFNGTAATIVTWSNTAIAAKVPTGATTGSVVVKVSGLASNGSPFTVLPAISSLSSTSGAVGDTVTITGTNFGTTQGSSTVTFNGTAATIITWSNTSITTKVPPEATTGNVVVTVGGLASNGMTFTLPVVISGLSPTTGVAGTTVTIAGINFGTTQGSSTATFNGTAATIITWSALAITAKVPTAATTGNVVVMVSGVASNGWPFTVLAPPTFSPSGGAYSGAQIVTMADSAPNATIYYTTNGNTPTTVSTVYTGAITVNSTETLEAIAVVAGLSSTPSTATYTLPAMANSTTTLAVTSSGSQVTTVASGSEVTLTATVASGGTAVTKGTVNFCDATAAFCTDVHLLGTAQLTSAGTAAINLRPAIGSHSYVAKFVGTSSYSASESSTTQSSAAQLTVIGTYSTITTISGTSGSAGDYTVTTQVGAMGSTAIAPTGVVSIIDTNSANAVLGTAFLSGSSRTLALANDSTSGTGNDPVSIAVGDLNGDGIPDLAVVNYNDNTITILLCDGKGNFQPAPNSPISVGSGPVSVAVGDFNGDGIPDLAVANIYSNTVTILLGQGGGRFAPAPNGPIAVGNYPAAVVAGDFNADGKLDLAVANENDSTVIILLGNGDGTFTAAANSPITVGNVPVSIAMGDFNADGKPDLAVANYSDGTVTILLGNGDGTFNPAAYSPVAVGSTPSSIVVADFRGIGKLDLTVLNLETGNVSTLLGNGNGTFNPATKIPTPAGFPVGFSAFSFAVGDFNRDGIPDLAVAYNADFVEWDYLFYYSTVRLLLGNGVGTFTDAAWSPSTTYNGPGSVAVGDFNGDGTPDLAVVNSAGNSVSNVQTNLAETATATATGIEPAGTGTHNIEAGYGGDSNDAPSMSSTTPLQTVPIGMSASLDPVESWFGYPVAVNISMSLQHGGIPTGTVNGGIPTGTVSCSGFGVTSAPVTVNSNGSATVQMNGLPLGKDAISCSFISNNSGLFSNTGSSAMIESVIVTPDTGTVSITPASATLYPGQTLQFTASVYNTSNQAVNWSVSPSSAGTISITGVFTASTTVTGPQTIAITATSQANTAQSASAMVTLSPPQCASSGYAYQRAIVIDHTKIPNTDQADFPFLFSTTDPVFKMTGNGGHVSNSSGDDIIFSTDPSGLTKLDHELEEYNPATGQVIAWVRIPTLSHTADTVLYVFYGNPSINVSQQNPAGVWDKNYLAVYHLDTQNTGAIVPADSTAYANKGTLTAISPVSGEIYASVGGAAGFNGASSFMQIPSADFASYPTSGSTTTGFSASFGVWFQTASAGVILGQTNGTQPGGNPSEWQPALYIDTAGLLRASLFSHGGANDQIVTATAYNDNKWHFAVDTYTNGTEELYVDGQLAGSQQVTQVGYNSAYGYFIGTGETANWPAGNGSWLYFNGAIDDVNVSNVARSGDWAQAEYNNQSSPSTFYAFYPENAPEVIPAAVNLSASQSQQFTVLGSKPGSCNSPAVTWSIPAGLPGTLTASGLYTAPNSIPSQQTVAITATTLGDSTSSISATVALIPAVTVSVTPGSATLSAGQTQQFTASVNNTSNTAVTFTVDPAGVGSLSALGLYTAPAAVTTQQTVIVTATSQADSAQSASVTITLAPPASVVPESGSVSPANMVLYGGQTQQFTAAANNNTNPSVKWTISPTGVGNLSAFGFYTAPATVSTQQTLTITATDQVSGIQLASATVTILPTPCGANGYNYVRTIDIDHTKVPNTDQANFPILISGTYPFLATIANGGRLQNQNGYDIAFSSDAAGQNMLSYEIDSYNGTTGAAAFWVLIPSLSHTADTTLYMWYGNSNTIASHENKPGVWSNGYAAVWHFGTPSALSTADSTANANNGINNGVIPAVGMVGGAGTFDGTGNTYLDIPSTASFKPATAFTLEAWVNMAGPTNWATIVSLGYRADGSWNSPYQAYGLEFYGSTLQPTIDVTVNGSLALVSGSNDIAVGQWTHIVGTYDGANLVAYANGVPVVTSPQVGPIDYGTSQDLAIGMESPYAPGAAVNGLIDETRISSVARSADWIATEYNNESSPSTFYSVSAENAFAVSPPVIGLYASQSQQFAATGVCNTTVTWTMSAGAPGNLTSGGLYTAPASIAAQQTVTITATNSGVPPNAATASITLMPPVAVSVTPATTTLTDDQTVQLTAIVANSFNQGVTWTLNQGAAGTISATGLYSAPSSIPVAQTVTITATSQEDTTKSASATITLSSTQCALNQYGYQRGIVIDHTKVPNTDQPDFPFLFNTTDPVFKSTAGGGQVTSPNGYDIIFSTDPNGLTKLDHELEEYNPSTGQVIAWVRIPTLSHTTDTIIYVFYGNPNIVSSQQNPAGVWDQNYFAVYHLDLENTGAAAAVDSTAYANNGTLTAISPASGEIDASVGGAAGLNGASSYIQLPQADFPNYPTGTYGGLAVSPTSETAPFSASFGVWFKTTSPGGILGQTPSQFCDWNSAYGCLFWIPTEPGDYDPDGWGAMLYVDDNGSLRDGGITTTKAYNDNNWHYAVATYANDGTDTLYVDGQNVGSAQEQFPQGYAPNYSYFVGAAFTLLSSEGNSNWLYFDGDIGQVSISSIPRSGDWIQTEYNNQSSPATFYTFNPASTAQVSPSAISLYATQSQQFGAASSCNSLVSWSISSGAPGILTSRGLYTAPGSITTPQTLTITAANQTSGTTIGSSVVTLLPPALPITLSAAAQPPYLMGSSQSFSATLRDQDGNAETGVAVTFIVNGANNNLGSSVTDSTGVASYTYTGANNGSDSILATAVIIGRQVTSNAVMASWNNPVPVNPEGSVALNAPSQLGQGGLVGAFTDSNGAVIEPLAVGSSSREFLVPAGATQLQLGVDDNHYADNGGPGFVVNVNGVPLAAPIPATAMPWNWVTGAGGLNRNYQFAMNDGTSPVVAATGLTPGETVSIAYQSGTVSTNYPISPLVNADGAQTWITGTTLWQGAYFPTLYTTKSSYPLGQPITFNALVTNSSGTAMPNVSVTLNVTGANPQQLNAITDATGTATFLYSGANAGTDNLQAQALPSGEGSISSGQASVTWTSYPAPPSQAGSLALNLFGCVNNEQAYIVMAKDASTPPTPVFDANVGFYVSGADNLSLSGTTNITGQAAFGYYHANTGAYNIVAVDSANRNVVISNSVADQWSGPCVSSTNTITVGISALNTVVQSSTLALTGIVTDSANLTPQATWSQVSGPGTVTFANPTQTTSGSNPLTLQSVTTATFSQIGTYEIALSASDASGASGSSGPFTVTVVPAQQDPQGWISSPAYGSAVSGLVPITLAPGVALQSGTLTYYPANNSNADPVLNANTTGSGTIATLDTTTIPNGSYWIQLQATNTSGEAQYSLVLVTVVGNYKPGRLTTTATDLVVPSTGLAINIQRTYDSLNSGTSSDFGFGWSLGYTVDLTVDPAGDVTFTLGGQRKTFYLTPQAPSLGILGFLPWYWPVYTPEPGMHGTLKETSSSCTNDLDMIVPNGSLWVCQNGGLYTPTGYVYTDPNGTAYTIGAAGNLQSIQDLSGNGLTITPSGITSTTGLSVPFVRDSSNRITQITDPAGNIFQYAYDSNGNLATVIYPVSAQSGSACSSATAPGTSTYTYDLTFIHLYAGGTDGRGCPLPITKYYPDGRVQSATDALGETTSYAYTLSTTSTINGVSVPNTGVTTITYPTDPADGSGQPDIATMIYDSYGDLLQSTDPLGNITSNAYDVNRNLISTTDQLGKTTTYTYDSNGNRTSTTYPATATSTNTTSYATFNQYSEQTSATDELVNVRTYNYDANFNPQSTTDSLGVVATFLFNSNSTLAAGAVGYDQTANPAMASQYTYDANGNLASSTDPLGRTTSYTYDSLGRKLSMTVPTATSLTGSALSTTTYQYDALSNLIQTNAPLGSITSSTYDANGNRTSSTDLDGHVTNYIYDALNRLVETDYPSNSLTPATKTTKTYDFRNNVVKAIDQDGNVTLNAYYLDGHLKSVTRAYGSTTTTPSTTSYTYDADGRRLTETDPLGHVTTNTYDNAGHLITVATVAGSTQYAYDNAGNQISVTDPRNNTTHYQYDARKRLVTTTYPDTTTTINAYDAQGNLVSVTDQAGNVVQSYYDAARQLTSTVQVDTLNQLSYTTTYSHDDAGNQTGVTDENGHKTTSAFDALSRLTSTILPDGSLTESRYYDAAGNLTSVSHFNGVTTTFAYDALNRLLSSTTPGETTVSFTYTNTGQRATMTDASGLTQYFYDSLDRLTSKVTPAQGTLSYTYDAAGNVASIKSSNANGVWVSYTYDDMGRLGTVVDNRLQGQQTTTYSYDAASNLATAAYPNNSISNPSAFTYDSLNRLTALASPVSSYNYTLGATGNRTKATEQGGRTLNWSYDGIYRLTNETITADPANKDGVVSYTLDSVGNRKAIASKLSGVNSGGTFSYNTDDELSTDAYDNNGDTLSTGGKNFSYDSENHLMGMNAGTVTLLYDGDGNRVAKTVGSVTTRYLVDDLNPTGLPQVVDELVGGAVTRQYTYGLDRISENQFVGGAWTPSFYGVDGGGSVRQLTNSSGAVTDTYEYDAFGNKVNSTGTTPNNYLYRGEQYDPDLGLYYLRARYYNPATGRFLNVDPMAGDGQRRYQYAAADPVNGMDPSGNFVLESYWPLHAPLTIHLPFPTWCQSATGNPMGSSLPPCRTPHWKVKVDWRPLYKQSNPKNSSELGTHYGIIGHWWHTFIEIDPPDADRESWGVLGLNTDDPTKEGEDQEVTPNNYRDPWDGGATGGYEIVPCTDQQAERLEKVLDETVYPFSSCPSCGKHYVNEWWKIPPDGFNSNTYSYNMINNFIGTPPPIDPHRAPGYHYSSRYDHYPF